MVLATQGLTACRHNGTLLLAARCGVRQAVAVLRTSPVRPHFVGRAAAERKALYGYIDHMERSLNDIYLAARGAIESVLDPAGFRLAGECHYPDSFGSAHADYRGRHQRVRLVWHGKDRFIGLSVTRVTNSGQHPAPDEWRALEPANGSAPAQFLNPGPGAERRIAELTDALRSHLEAAV